MPRLTPELANLISKDYTLNDAQYERRHFAPIVQRAPTTSTGTASTGPSPQELFQYTSLFTAALNNGAAAALGDTSGFMMQTRTITAPASIYNGTPLTSDTYGGVYFSNNTFNQGRISLPSFNGLTNQRWYIRFSWQMGTTGTTNIPVFYAVNNCTIRSSSVAGSPWGTAITGNYWVSQVVVVDCTNTSRCTLDFDRPQSIAGTTVSELNIDLFIALGENTIGALPVLTGTNLPVVP